MKTMGHVLILLFVRVFSLYGQEPSELFPPEPAPPASERPEFPEPPVVTGPLPGTFEVLAAEFEDPKVVKGAPYSAEAVIERSQTLADGNRIHYKTVSMIYRDSEGRIRREQQVDPIGTWRAARDLEPLVFIFDPVSGYRYVLQTRSKIARKMKTGDFPWPPRPPRPPRPPQDADRPLPPPPPAGPPHPPGDPTTRFYRPSGQTKTEDLGKKVMEGITAEGTRIVTTIPANEIGNERPMEIVSEKWYSPELKVNIMTKHSDPRFGETTYRLTRIKQEEPDAALFQIPEDYRIEEGHRAGMR